jgi:hypothetical protein
MSKKCPFYEEITVRYCRVLAKRIMIPSRSEKEKFCTCDKFEECPLFQEYKKNKDNNYPVKEQKVKNKKTKKKNEL